MSSIIEASNDTINFTEAVDPTAIFGPPRDALYLVIPITMIYAVILFTGLFGNIFTCLVIVRNKNMHTATNYYLFSLAISDLLLLVSGMPQEIYSIWSKWPYIFGNTFCVIRGLAAETSTNASVLTITLFTIERYLAICHPFVSQKMSKLSRATRHVMWLWVVSLCLALPQALQFGIRETNGVIMCLQTRIIIKYSFEISTFVFFLAPMVLISVLYALIGLKLRETSICNQQARRDFERSFSYTHKLRIKQSQSTNRVVKMLVAVVIGFFVCWAPFHAQRLVAIYGTTENHLARSPILLSAYYFLTYTSGVFYYMSTCINPIFYHIMSHKFRDCFKNSIEWWCCRRRRAARNRCSYTAMAFVRNPTSSGTGNSGNSLQNERSAQTRTVRQDSRDRFNGYVHVCRNGGCIAPPVGEDYIYKRRFPNEKDMSRSDELRMNFAHERRCTSVCCANHPSPTETILVTPEPILFDCSNETLQFSVHNPSKYFKENKLRTTQKEKEKEYG